MIFLHYGAGPADLHPTGFLQSDQPSYAAMARQYFDQGFGPTYSLPFDSDDAGPRFYAQPYTLLMGLLWNLSGWDPGVVTLLLGSLGAIVFMRAAIALYSHVVPLDCREAWAGLPLFVWGGGLLALAGLLHWVLLDPTARFSSIFLFDPTQGFWFLNLGRNLYMANEAAYHALALGLLWALVAQRAGLALLLAAVLSASHPFTGLQFALVLVAFSTLEAIRRAGPLWLPLAALGLLAAHLAYYLLLVGGEPTQAGIMQQYAARYRSLPLTSSLLAYAPVTLFALMTLRHRAVWQRLPVRLCVCVALVSVGLENHELFITPDQPLHFTRGYLWLALFLLGAPTLVIVLGRLRRGGLWARFALAGIFMIALSDNALWFAQQGRTLTLSNGEALYLSTAEQALFAYLQQPALRGALVIGERSRTGYLTTVYTPLNAYVSHWDNTPDRAAREAEVERWRAEGVLAPTWQGRRLLFVVEGDARSAEERPWFDPAQDSILRDFGELTLVLRDLTGS